MQKKELIWREIAFQALERRNFEFQQKEQARTFRISLSTVFNALKGLRDIGAIKVGSRSFAVTDVEKLLAFWATHRRLQRDIVYATRVDAPVREIESSMPPGIVFGGFTAYRLKYNDVPADYDKVYVYADDPKVVERRFPKQPGYENLYVLQADPHLSRYGSTSIPAAQLYVDLWNLTEWYAAEFLKALKRRIFPTT